MIFWHTGVTLAILWFVFRGNPRLDYRLAALGALLPDIVDKFAGRVLFRDRFESGHLWGHTLLVNVAFFCVLFFMRGRIKRRLVLVPTGSLLHLAEDAMWSHPEVFWWPLFGSRFPSEPIPGGALAFLNPVREPVFLVQEAVGIALLVWLFAAHRMLSWSGVKAFLRTGRLEQGGINLKRGAARTAASRFKDRAEEGRDSTGQDAG